MQKWFIFFRLHISNCVFSLTYRMGTQLYPSPDVWVTSLSWIHSKLWPRRLTPLWWETQHITEWIDVNLTWHVTTVKHEVTLWSIPSPNTHMYRSGENLALRSCCLLFFCICRQWQTNIKWMFQKPWTRFWTCLTMKVNICFCCSFVFLFIYVSFLIMIYLDLNRTVRRANVPEMLSEDYISDVEEGIFCFVIYHLSPAHLLFFSQFLTNHRFFFSLYAVVDSLHNVSLCVFVVVLFLVLDDYFIYMKIFSLFLLPVWVELSVKSFQMWLWFRCFAQDVRVFGGAHFSFAQNIQRFSEH